MPLRVSIVVPFRNQGVLLCQACRSLQAQTMAEWECLLIDDGSEEESVRIATTLVASDPRFCLLHVADPDHFPGPWLARNLGISAARAELVAFLDADDLWHPKKLETQLDVHTRLNVHLSVTGYYRFEERDLKVREYRIPPRSIRYGQLFLGNVIPLSSVLAHKSLLRHGFQPERHEDYGLWLRLFANNSPLAYGCVSDALMAYRLHGASLSSKREWSILAVEKLFRKQISNRLLSRFAATTWLLIRCCSLLISLTTARLRAPQKLPRAFAQFIVGSYQHNGSLKDVTTSSDDASRIIQEMSPAGWIQLLREWPPGYGGIERVAHEMSDSWQKRGMSSITLSLKSATQMEADPLPASYARSSLPHLSFGQLLVPLPHRRILAVLLSPAPLYVHLPCPSLLVISILARLLQPQRRISLHWHVFLERVPGPRGWLITVYQWLALRWAAWGVQQVITTSPVLAAALRAEGVPCKRLAVLPCCLSESTEMAAAAIWKRRLSVEKHHSTEGFRVLFIGRLNRYKRVDWLIKAFTISQATSLEIVGDGVMRADLEILARCSPKADSIRFHGRVTEQFKASLLEFSDLLVLPADQSNEAFGIVQLESMACGVPALALERARSGMTWVSALGESLGNPQPWPLQGPEDLATAMTLLAMRPDWYRKAMMAARLRYEKLFARRIWQQQLETIIE
ncbi:glycosyltransferase [Synechococcus sp. J7-Johnson]|uniref:glycosyltransferase n=1 Tax=Synechococcus sp. J7-Johnson TaxID=2823737 RepID=UPI0020CCF185|nr:glycosyltransferase [Synechococcus sp. J7-Johnson]